MAAWMFHDCLNLDVPTHATHVASPCKDHVALLLLTFLQILLHSWHWVTILFVCDLFSKHAQKNQTLGSNHVQMGVKERAEIANR